MSAKRRGIVPMSESEYKAAEYRRQAALCLELAERISLLDDRERILDMAERFLELAREEEGKAE